MNHRAGDVPTLLFSESVPLEWTRVSGDYPRNKTLHELFEEQVRRVPERVAVEFRGQTWSYHELNEQADHLAVRLRSAGVGPDILVGLCAERSFEMIVAMLGILKAGGAYVPLDPSLPKERFQFLLEDTRTPVLVEAQRSGVAVRTVRDALEARESTAGGFGRHSPTPIANQDSLAYVMYTSGTTGRPKGVMIPHLGVVRLVINPNYVTLTPDDVLLQFAPFSFDASTFEIWGSLLNGGRLVIYPPGPVDLRQLGEFIRASRITTLWLTAALFHQMLELAPDAVAGVRQLLAGGDVLAPAKVRRYLEIPGHGRLINGYGPTENTTFTCCAVFDRPEDLDPLRSVPIGRPISGTEVRLLDPAGQLVPVGAIGEIFAGGDGLARGYWGASELTMEKFVPDPFRPGTGSRLYRTGDLARWRPEGVLEFLGRRDHQVKIRGYRIELEEIEAVLGGHPDLRECAVVVSEIGSSGDRELVAFIVCREENQPRIDSLRGWLREKLPAYMIPVRFLSLSSLPLYPSGKLNRQALAAFVESPSVPASNNAAVRPSSNGLMKDSADLERSLLGIWRSILNRESITVHDHFLDLGGHSLLAATLTARIAQQLGVILPAHEIFAYPTIAALAERIEIPRATHLPVEAMPRVKRGHPLPMSFGQERMWLLHQTLPDPAAYNEPVAYRMIGKVDPARIRRTLGTLLDRHEILRTSLVRSNDSFLQQIAEPGAAHLCWRVLELDSRSLPGEPAALGELDGSVLEPAMGFDGGPAGPLATTVLEESRRPFDLGLAPLWRVLWIRQGAEDHVLLIVFHHSIVDEWSLRLFFREFESVYAGLSEDRREGSRCALDHRSMVSPALIPERPSDPSSGSHEAGSARQKARDSGETPSSGVEYADYAVWQRRQLTPERAVQLRAYWVAVVGDVPPPLVFPEARVRPSVPTGRGMALEFTLDSATTRLLRELARAENTTVFTVLLAAFNVFLLRCTGQSDFIVATPIADRSRSEVQHTLGFFLHTVPLRARFTGTVTFRAALTQACVMAREAFDHAALPFEQIVSLAQRQSGPRTLSPLHQILFSVVEEALPTLRFGEAVGRPMSGVNTGASKCDLAMNLQAEGEVWRGHIEFCADIFGPDAAAALVAAFIETVAGLAAHPDLEINDLPSLAGLKHQGGTGLQAITPVRAAPADPVAPRDDLEAQLTAIWKAIFCVERVGIHDDFFALGGHSLSAARMQAQVEITLGRRLPLAVVFESPTVEGIARWLRGNSLDEGDPKVVRMSSLLPDKPPLFCPQFLWAAQKLAQTLEGRWTVYGVDTPLDEGVNVWREQKRLVTTIEEVARHCLRSVRRVQPKGPYFLSGYCFAGVVAFEMAAQLKAAGEKVAFLGFLDAVYLPGCKPVKVTMSKRLAYHGASILNRGVPYLRDRVWWRLCRFRKLWRHVWAALTRKQALTMMLPQPIKRQRTVFYRQLLANYRTSPYPDRVFLYRTRPQPLADLDLGQFLGWDAVVRNHISVDIFDCGHGEMNDEPYITEVGARMFTHMKGRFERESG